METNWSRKLFMGFVFIAAGVLILLFNLGILPSEWRPVILSLGMLVLMIGIAQFLNHHPILGLIFSIIGVVLILPKLFPLLSINIPEATIHNLFWPVIIILIGISLISRHNHCLCCDGKRRGWFRQLNDVRKKTEEGKIDYNVILNGSDEIFLGPVFRGGEINTIMGGVKLDLRKTTLPEGTTILNIDSVCGGVDLILPDDWNVEIANNSILGGFDNKRHTNGTDYSRKLLIKANFIMAGGSIR